MGLIAWCTNVRSPWLDRISYKQETTCMNWLTSSKVLWLRHQQRTILFHFRGCLRDSSVANERLCLRGLVIPFLTSYLLCPFLYSSGMRIYSLHAPRRDPEKKLCMRVFRGMATPAQTFLFFFPSFYFYYYYYYYYYFLSIIFLLFSYYK